MGKVTLTVTIDGEGRVQNVEAVSDNPKFAKILENSAVENLQHWTFTKPTVAPSKRRVVYDYVADESLPASGGPKNLPAIVKVTIDLPDHVRIAMNNQILETSR